MTRRPSINTGDPVEFIDTPALLLDLDSFERNLNIMAEETKHMGISLRPHAKTHKSVIIAHKQLALGAVGLCCQTVEEAELLVEGGVKNVLVSNQVIGHRKIERFMALGQRAEVMLCVDNAENIRALADAANRQGVRPGVLVEIEVGMGRCGVAAGEPALELARKVDAAPGLRFMGIQAYHGAAQHIRSYAERSAAIDDAARRAGKTKELLEKNNLPCTIISGGGTGSYEFEANSGVYNEIQAGSYVFMDVDYAKNEKEDGSAFNTYEHSLFVLTTVISRPSKNRAIVDAGLKSHSVDSGMPGVYGRSDLQYTNASDEHGILELEDPSCGLEVGDYLKLVPGHCDPTVNLHNCYIGIRGERVEEVWPVLPRDQRTYHRRPA